MSIKEQIAKLPDGAELWENHHPVRFMIPATKLKALADSHTRLLEAAKKSCRTLQTLSQPLPDGGRSGDKIIAELIAVIEEAENL